MEKKKYIKPSMTVYMMGKQQLLAGSGVSSSFGIEYGGIDPENGLVIPQ